MTEAARNALTTSTTSVPLWGYNTTSSRNNQSYSGTMVGASPFTSPNSTTSVSTQLIPLKIVIGSHTFDPTAPNPCASAPLVNSTDVSLVQNSPIFTDHAYTMNGVNVGTTQYVDAFQRASFWNSVSGQSYSVKLSVTTLGVMTVTVPAASSTIYQGGCAANGNIMGGIDYDYIDNLILTTLIPSLAGQGVGPTTFPLFLISNVVIYDTTTSNCCILGYHGAASSGSNLQTYSISDFDTTGSFGNTRDASVLTHEVAEWMDDPSGGNPTPAWGGIGQVGGCQGNLEVGDPLSGTLFPNVVMPNGYTYHVQELAYYSWFFGRPSIAAGGKYSNNGTFAGDAKACPPGGTNQSDPPANDNFANRISIFGYTTSLTATGSNSGATTESGEVADGISGSGTETAWWTWTAPCSFTVTSSGAFIDTIGSAFDTVLGIYTGSSVGSLVKVLSDDDSGGGGTSRVPSGTPGPSTFNVISGTPYQIRVRGYFAGGTGAITLHITRPVCTFTDPSLAANAFLIKAVHITELRYRIDAQRARFGLPAFAYTNPTLTVGTSGVKAADISDLRTALQQAYTAGGFAIPAYTDPSLTVGVSTIKAIHITELRDAVIALEAK